MQKAHIMAHNLDEIFKDVMASAWDQDGCKYPYDSSFGATPGIEDKNIDNDCNRTAVYALFLLKDEKLPNDIMPWLKIAEDSYNEKGTPVFYFAKEHGIPFEVLDRKFHEILSVEKMIPETHHALYMEQSVNLGHKTALVTHSHPVLVKRSIPQLGLSNVYNTETNVFTLSQFGPEHRKHRSPEMFLHSIKTMDIDPSNAIVVEDTSENLEPVKETEADVITVLVDRDGRYKSKPDHINVVVKNATEISQSLVRVTAQRDKSDYGVRPAYFRVLGK